MRFLSAFLSLVLLLVACLAIKVDLQRTTKSVVGRLIVETDPVLLSRRGKKVKVEQRVTLFEGDTIEVGANGTASITQIASRKAWKVSGPAKVSLGATSVASKPPQNLKLVYSGNYPSRPITAGTVGAVTVVRGEPDGKLRPFGALLDRPVVLSWQASGPVDVCAAKVVDAKGKTVWESAARDFTASELTIPADRMKTDTIYRATVRLSTIRPNGQLVDTELDTQFVLLGSKQIEKLNADMISAKKAFASGAARVFAVADVLASYGRIEQLEEWLSTELVNPAKGEIHHWMAEYLERMGFKKAARDRSQLARAAGFQAGS